MFRQDKPRHASFAQQPKEGLILESPILRKHAVSHAGDQVGTTAVIPTRERFNDPPRYFDLSRFRI